MSQPILATKLYIPRLRPELVLRPRLLKQLNEGLQQGGGFGRKLTLISAAAGFGKTTVVSSWINQQKGEARGQKAEVNEILPSKVAWLSLEEADSDPARFLTYFIAALQTTMPTIGEGLLPLLQSPQPPTAVSILTTLLNEITAVSHNIILVLDDYHLIDAQPIDEALTFLLEHLPPQMHLVIATREDPNLPLPRLRVRGELTELRAADLRFTLAEAAKFFNQVMGLSLSVENIATLESRTEGWIAGLQMVALSLQGSADAESFIQAFSGSHRFVLDYLVEEVLHSQAEDVRQFLLKTSIINRLNSELCTAVTGQPNSSHLLTTLERGNLFVIPLDDQRHWYRYHHLFADVLQAHAITELAEQLPVLHLQASDWYAQQGLLSEAIHHALAAKDFERAADLIELAWPALEQSYRGATFNSWLQALPDGLVRTRPLLSLGYAWGLLDDGDLEAGNVRLQDAERLLDALVGSDEQEEAQIRSLTVMVATARAYHAQAIGDTDGTMRHAHRALDLLPEKAYQERGIPAALLGIAQWASGALEAAHDTMTEVMLGFQQGGNHPLVIGGAYVLADIRLAQGRLHEASDIYQRALQVAMEPGKPVIQGAADMYRGLSKIQCEWGDLAAAAQQLQQGKALGKQAKIPGNESRWLVAEARLKMAQGDLDDALTLLQEAERVYLRGPYPVAQSFAAQQARIWLMQGKLNKALAWVQKQDLSIDDDLSYPREFDHITLARVRLAQHHHHQTDDAIDEAMSLLARLLKAAEDGGRKGSVIQILLLQAVTHEAQEDISAALVALKQALLLAESEGFIQLFVDEGQPIAKLLTRVQAEDGRQKAYLHQLLAAFGEKEIAQPSTNSSQPLVDPLSQRELEVLGLIAEGLSNREIGERLFLALSTVKGHNRLIFDKLNVQRRTEAVAKARALGLL